ncbi:hypothetical protein [Achromobacter aegrifaciens]
MVPTIGRNGFHGAGPASEFVLPNSRCSAIVVGSEELARIIRIMEKQKQAGTILLRNTMAFDRAHADEFRQAIEDAVRFAQENAPQLMVQVFWDLDQGLCYSFQLYADSEAILRHWEVSDPHIAAVMKHCVVKQMEVYGSPNQAVRNGILAAVGSDKVTITPELVGYYRLG